MDNISEDDILNLMPLEDNINDIANKIVNEKDLDKIKDLTNLFNLNQAKKDILRVDAYGKLIDCVTDQMGERLRKRPDEFSNADLISYLSAINNSIERAKKSYTTVNDTPAIQINQVNINNDDKLNRESREKVLAVIDAIMKRGNKDLDTVSNNDTKIIETVTESIDTEGNYNEEIQEIEVSSDDTINLYEDKLDGEETF